MTKIENLMVESFKKNGIKENDKDVALLFSSGIDSMALLYTCFNMGINPTLYTFRLEDYVSTDFKKSKEIADKYNLKFVPILIKTPEIQDLYNDIVYIIKEFDSKKKTHIECTWPFLTVEDYIEENKVLIGMRSVGLVGGGGGLAKDIYFAEKRKGLNECEKIFKEYRISKFNDNDNPGSSESVNTLLNDRLVLPYHDKDLFDHFQQFTYHDVNKPYEKSLLVEAFPAFAALGKKWARAPEGYQANSKIRDMFEMLLADTTINKKSRKRTMDLYRDIYKEVKNKNKLRNFIT